MKYLIYIALGGAGGAVSRYLLANWVYRTWESAFPFGTLVVNMLGSIAIGALYVILVERQFVHPDWRSVLIVGFLGAFTTFSTFSIETVSLMESGHTALAALYMVGSAVVCVALAGIALQLTRLLV